MTNTGKKYGTSVVCPENGTKKEKHAFKHRHSENLPKNIPQQRSSYFHSQSEKRITAYYIILLLLLMLMIY